MKKKNIHTARKNPSLGKRSNLKRDSKTGLLVFSGKNKTKRDIMKATSKNPDDRASVILRRSVGE